jgi:tyrosinase
MLNGWSSINDPLFYMHHANLDRIWGIWQDKTPANLYAIGGPIYPVGTGETTLETVVDMGEFLAPSVPVRKVMDPINRNGDGVLSYVYTGNGHKTI